MIESLRCSLVWFVVASLVSVMLVCRPCFGDNSTPLSASKSLCKVSEELFWGCETEKNKHISFCKSQGFSKKAGYLVYRYGSRENIELELPKNKKTYKSFFSYARRTQPQSTFLSLSFVSDGWKYYLRQDDHYGQESTYLTVSKGSTQKEINCLSVYNNTSLMRFEGVVKLVKDEFQ